MSNVILTMIDNVKYDFDNDVTMIDNVKYGFGND